MTVTIAHTVGVDIFELSLDVYLHPHAVARQFPNTASGIKTLLARLGQTTLHRVVFEPTAASSASSARPAIPMVKVDPLQARRFAEAIG